MRVLLVALICILFFVGCGTTDSQPEEEIYEVEVEEETVEVEEQVEEEEAEKQKELDQDIPEESENEDIQSPLMYKLNETNWRVQPINHEQEQVVLLTIDDAPDKYALEMAYTLSDLDVSAIFFVNGHIISTEEKKEWLKEIYELGHEIGNHTLNHPNLSHLSEEDQYNEIVKLNDLIEEIIGERPRFFRAPFGVNTDYSKEIVRQENMQWMNWTYGYDWEKAYLDADKLADIMVNTNLLSNGANLLMHDREWTKDALPDIVKGLQEKGYEIVDPKQIK